MLVRLPTDNLCVYRNCFLRFRLFVIVCCPSFTTLSVRGLKSMYFSVLQVVEEHSVVPKEVNGLSPEEKRAFAALHQAKIIEVKSHMAR